MRESFTSGTVGGALGNQRIYPELLCAPKLITFPDVICSQTPLQSTVHR